MRARERREIYIFIIYLARETRHCVSQYVRFARDLTVGKLRTDVARILIVVAKTGERALLSTDVV